MAREEEDVIAVGARVAEVGLIVAFPGRDQVQTAAGAFPEARARTGAAVAPTGPFALPLVDIGLFVLVLGEERFFGLEIDTITVFGEVAREESITFRGRLDRQVVG